MSSEILDITSEINQFLDGLFLGFSLVTLLAIVVYAFTKSKLIHTFIYHSVKLVRVLAIVYLIFYLCSFIFYYSTKEFELYSERASGPYAYSYWMMLMRPVFLCGLLQLFWIKRILQKMRYIAIITFLVFICSLLSGYIFELIVIMTAAYHRDAFMETSQSDKITYVFLVLSIIEKCILYSALVFIIWAIKKNSKLN